MLIVSSSPAAAMKAVPCKASTSDTWLSAKTGAKPGVAMKLALVRPVVQDMPAAIALLEKRSVVALSPSELSRFLGPAAKPAPTDPGLHPYLVRAVFPTPYSNLAVQWSGNDLHITAEGLGCLAYKKHPAILFLDRKPAAVFVSAGTDL
jgi:hypothetical protein